LAKTYGRYGYRRVTALLRDAGWTVNAKRVERIWRQEGLKVPQKQPKRGRLWLNDGSCVRLRAERPNHVWAYDFVEDRTHDGRKFRMLCVIDEFTREALAIRVKRRLNSTDVLETLADLMIMRGLPAYVRSDNGPEFIAITLRKWIAAVGSQTAYIEPGSPWVAASRADDEQQLPCERTEEPRSETRVSVQVQSEHLRRHVQRQRRDQRRQRMPPQQNQHQRKDCQENDVERQDIEKGRLEPQFHEPDNGDIRLVEELGDTQFLAEHMIVELQCIERDKSQINQEYENMGEVNLPYAIEYLGRGDNRPAPDQYPSIDEGSRVSRYKNENLGSIAEADGLNDR
jgi:putative transposase